MKKYTTPKISFIDLNPADIIATSSYQRMDISDYETFDDEDFIG